MGRRWTTASGVLALSLALAACGGGGTSGGTVAPTTGGTPNTQSPAGCDPSSVQTLVASGLKFDRTCIAVPPHRTTTLTLINNDPGQSHNVAIYRSDSCLANAVAAGDASTCSDLTDGLRFKGPVVAHGQATYHILGLRPGNYAFICTVHPTMHGAFKVA